MNNYVICGIAEFESPIPDAVMDEISGLLDAIERKAYPTIYKELRRFTEPFFPRAAFLLLCEALEKSLTLRAFEAILDRSPPLPEFLYASSISHVLLCRMGLVEYAACLDRADVLSLFLERGAGPNRADGFEFSPLEAALEGDSLKCVELLMRQPELDTSWTPRLLTDWVERWRCNPVTDSCLQAMAPRFTWVQLSCQTVPVPEATTADILAESEDWPLMECFCRERPVSRKEVFNALRVISGRVTMLFSGSAPDGDVHAACARALAALLECCPGLLESYEARWRMLHCFLALGEFSEGAQAALRPWAESLGSQQIAVHSSVWEYWHYVHLPDFWRKLLPNGPALAIDRWSHDWADSFWVYLSPPGLRHILSCCPILGSGRKGYVSHLARAVLLYGDVPMIESLSQNPDGLLATEDPGALADFVLEADLPRAKRAAVLSYLHKEADYDL